MFENGATKSIWKRGDRFEAIKGKVISVSAIKEGYFVKIKNFVVVDNKGSVSCFHDDSVLFLITVAKIDIYFEICKYF